MIRLGLSSKLLSSEYKEFNCWEFLILWVLKLASLCLVMVSACRPAKAAE